MKTRFLLWSFVVLALGMSVQVFAQAKAASNAIEASDIHSFSNPHQVRVTHVDLDWKVNFSEKMIKGSATLSIQRARGTASEPLILDTRDLTIEKVESSSNGGSFRKTAFELGSADKILGSSLTVKLPRGAKFVRVHYATSPTASGLQWLAPEQTAGRKSPYMFSQAQAIHARSFVPLQDSPQVRITYSARVQTPKNLLALMSAEGNLQTNERSGDYRFVMTKPIPSYLIAIAVGDIKFKSLGPRTGVYSEESMLKSSAWELADTEKMVIATEKIYGQYAWGRYDLLVLPPSFPFGGMENPLLTFATPTIIAGDRSLVSLVAHELAHSWSGNLVTNATWRDFWLNEGFTTYLERRIIEAVYGVNRREMEAMLGKRSLLEELSELPSPDQILHIELTGRDPDDGMTSIAYEKGALFLRWLEEKFGRAKFDAFVKGYFAKYAFKSITTDTFVDHLQKNLINKNPSVVSMDEINEWIRKAGLPASAPNPASDAFTKVEAQVKSYLDGKTKPTDIQTKGWTTQEWLHFLKTMPETVGTAKMAELDKTFNFTKIGNSEIAFQWLLMSIKNNYAAADARLEEFLVSIGRRKFVRPLFNELAKTPNGMKRAKEIYQKARSGYHPITQSAVDAIVMK